MGIILSVALAAYKASGVFLSAILFLSGFLKLYKTAAAPAAHSGFKGGFYLLQAFSNSPAFSIFLILLGLLIAAPIGAGWHALAAGLAAGVAMLGVALSRSRHGLACRCFGAWSAGRPAERLALQGLLCGAGCLVAIMDLAVLPAPAAPDGGAVLALLLFGALTAGWLRWRRADHVAAGAASAATTVPAAEPPRLAAATPLGTRAGAAVTLGQAAVADRPLLVVTLSHSCPQCLELVGDLRDFCRAFGARFPIAVISDSEAVLAELAEPAGDGWALLDPALDFSRQLGAQSLPCAALLHGGSLARMAPLAHGGDRIRILFALALNTLAPARAV